MVRKTILCVTIYEEIGSKQLLTESVKEGGGKRTSKYGAYCRKYVEREDEMPKLETIHN